MITRDKKITITHNFIVGHTYEVVVAARDKQGRQQDFELAPSAVITIHGKTENPATTTGLTATAAFRTIFLEWTNPDDRDYAYTEVWRASTNNRASATLIAEVNATFYADTFPTSGLTRYYWVRAVNRTGNFGAYYPASATAGVSATTGSVTPTDIEDFAITASKTFLKIPVLQSDSWTDNSPGGGSIAWNQHNIAYNGAWYQVTAGNTASKFVYWVVGSTGGTGTVADPYITNYSTSATEPSHTDTTFIIATNISGTHNTAWNAIANQVIGSAYILDAAITNAKIGLLAVDTANIANAAVTNLKVAGCNVNKLEAGTITSKDILLSITEGTGDCAIRAGKSDFTNVDAGFILGLDDSDSNRPKFYIGDSSTYLNWTGTALAIKGSVTITGGSGIASLSDAGSLATLDAVGASNCDTTIIDGGKIITGLLTADNVQAGTLTGRTVQTASSGQRVVIDGTADTLSFYNSAGNLAVELDGDAAYGTVPTLLLGTYGGIINLYNDSNNNITAISAPAAGTGAKNTQITVMSEGGVALIPAILTAWDSSGAGASTIFGVASVAAGAAGWAGNKIFTVGYNAGAWCKYYVDAVQGFKTNSTQVVGAQGAAVADASDPATCLSQLNALLARCRAHGLIAT